MNDIIGNSPGTFSGVYTDGSLTGNGTKNNPLHASGEGGLLSVSTDGVTIDGTGLPADPLYVIHATGFTYMPSGW
jgi:hypothetical protein